MSNTYWPVYKNLERNVDDLSFTIHIDDFQLGVYSSRITDLILRAAVEIESLSKELYRSSGGTESGEYKFDDVALKHLKNLWLLDHKKVIISSPHCFQSNRVLMPFVKNETRTSSSTGRQTYSWNNAYQNLKHDRAQFLRFGSIKYLFDIMAALFVLNIYYKNEVIALEKDSVGVNFPTNLGSSLFSVELIGSPRYAPNSEYIKSSGFDSAIYFVTRTPESERTFQESIHANNSHQISSLLKHPKMLQYLVNNNISNYEGSNLAWDILGQDEYIRVIQQSQQKVPIKWEQLKYQAILNKNTV